MMQGISDRLVPLDDVEVNASQLQFQLSTFDEQIEGLKKWFEERFQVLHVHLPHPHAIESFEFLGLTIFYLEIR